MMKDSAGGRKDGMAMAQTEESERSEAPGVQSREPPRPAPNPNCPLLFPPLSFWKST